VNKKVTVKRDVEGMSVKKITLKRINQRNNKIVSVGCSVDTIALDVDGIIFRIEPDFNGIQITKDGFEGAIKITPCVSNSIIVE